MDEAEADLDTQTRQMPSPGVMFGVGMAIVGLGVLGWMIYRSRRRQTIVKQLTAAIPVDRRAEGRPRGALEAREVALARQGYAARLANGFRRNVRLARSGTGPLPLFAEPR